MAGKYYLYDVVCRSTGDVPMQIKIFHIKTKAFVFNKINIFIEY